MVPARLFLAALLLAGAARAAVEWRALAPGLDLTEVVATIPSDVGDSRITVVRADPARWQLALVGPGASGDEQPKTAREWARSHRLVLATNAGMFATDHRTHIGYLESGGEVRRQHVNDYQSVAAFDPRDPDRVPPFRIFDLDAPGVGVEAIRRDYASLVQNLRLVKKPGANRWGPQPRRWSEAALGEDAEGRALFIHCRSPFSMRDLNRELLAAGIGLVAAQHLEGGPEAQLYLDVGETVLELVGSFETDFLEDESNAAAWPVPHVLGLRPRE
jgi:hypothetical protein